MSKDGLEKTFLVSSKKASAPCGIFGMPKKTWVWRVNNRTDPFVFICVSEKYIFEAFRFVLDILDVY